nr:unnamed protein product [Leishmania braziliensis]
MISQALLSAVERDLAAARQLVYFHADLYADEEEADKNGDPVARFRHPPASLNGLHGGPTTVTNAGCSRAVLSNPVPRPRQGTCAVLMELSRPLTWLSQRGRHRGRGAGVGAAARTGTATTTTPSATSSHVNHVSARGGPGMGEVGGRSGPTVNNSSSTSASVAATESNNPHMRSGNLVSGTGALSAVHENSYAPTSNAGVAASSLSGAAEVPLLVATVALEVVFPARYPSEPCQWQLFEEASFGDVGDHSTSSWAVTADHHRGSTTGGSSGATSKSHHLRGSMASPVGCRSSSTAWNAGGVAEDGACGASGRGDTSSPSSNHGKVGGTDTEASTLTALVVSDVGRRMLRWITEARAGMGNSFAPFSPSLATMMAGNATANAWGGQGHQYSSSTSKGYPFLLDFAVLLRIWCAMELDVHHLILPSRTAMAYGGGGARVPRAMASMHLSGGAGATATAPGASTPAALLLPSAAAGSLSVLTAAAASSPTVCTNVAATGASTAVGGGAVYGGATSSTASVPAPAQGATSTGGGGAAATGGGVSSGIVASGAVAGVAALYPFRHRPAKCFMAVLLPLGDVAIFGTPMPARRASNRVSSTTADSSSNGPGATTPRPLSRRLPSCLRHIYERQQSASWHEKRHAGTVVSCTSQFELGKVLPSYVLPAHVLGTAYKCEWDNVRLFSGKTVDATLHANAKLAKALRLPDVCDLLQVLRRLAKNVGTPSTGMLYVSEVLWPALMETVRVLRDERLPLWAGMAVCSLLLPSVLQQVDSGRQVEPGGSGGSGRGHIPVSILRAYTTESTVGGKPPVQLHRRHLAELIEVVSFTEQTLAVAREHTLLCEVRLVRFSLQRALLLLQRDGACGHYRTGAPADWMATRAQTYLGHGDSSNSPSDCAAAALIPLAPLMGSSAEMCRRVHAPISICAVCGLSLLCSTVTHPDTSGSGSAAPLTEMRCRSRTAASATSDSDTLHRAKDGEKGGSEAVRAALRTWRAEGCLIVQCARCGHGGHVEHISSWWNDPTVRCCPKGCDCRCVY